LPIAENVTAKINSCIVASVVQPDIVCVIILCCFFMGKPRHSGDSENSALTAALMSAIGPKRTSLVAPHMSAFGGKAGIDQPGG
jgi:hypothetical protein